MFRWLSLSAILLVSAEALALNGSNLLGVSPAGTALGGTGVANAASPTEVLHKNPALLTSLGGLEAGKTAVELDLTLLKVNASMTYSVTSALPISKGTNTVNSASASRIIPQVGAAYRLNDSWVFGLGFVGYAGTMADYSGEAPISKQKTDVGITKLVPTVAFSPVKELSLGAAPVIGYGTFMLNEDKSTGDNTQSNRAEHGSVALGFQLGANYEAMEGLNFGAAYIHKTKYTYKQLTDFAPFGGATANGLDDLILEQPMEFALGAKYSPMKDLLLTFDYRLIGWSGCAALKEFGWSDQNVFALGSQYRVDNLVLRLGFNYAKAPLDDVTNETGHTRVDLQGTSLYAQSISSLNVASFPAVTSTHITAGAGYDVTPDVTVDLGLMYAFGKVFERAGVNADPAFGGGTITYSYKNNINQWAVSLGSTIRL